MVTDESTAAAPRGNPDILATVDHASVAMTPSGSKLAVTLTITIELDDATALDLIMQAVGAIARMREGER